MNVAKILVTAWLALLALPTIVEAQSTVAEQNVHKIRVGIVKGNRLKGFSPSLRAQILARVHATLNDQGYGFMPEEEVEARMTEKGPNYEQCTDPEECATLVLKAIPELHACFGIDVWFSERDKKHVSVVAAIYTRKEETHAGSTYISTGGSMDLAASDATLKAIQEYEKEKEHPSPSLYQPSTNHNFSPTNNTSVSTSSNSNTLSEIGPWILGGVGVLGITLGVMDFAADGCDRKASDGTCLEGHEADGTLSTIAIVGGSAALIGAGAWYLFTHGNTKSKNSRSQASQWGVSPYAVTFSTTF